MKKACIVTVLSVCLFGCNMNPNKEARIQKLESEIVQLSESIKLLENRIKTLEDTNEKLKSRIPEAESH